jgi:hypothetical protein
MLVIDHAERITAKDALEHPYFASIKPESADSAANNAVKKPEVKQN